MTMSRLSHNLILLMLSVLLLATGIWITGYKKLIDDFAQFPIWVVMLVLTLFAANLSVVSYRLGRLLRYFGVNVSYSRSLQASLQGYFASLFFISLFGQVAGRYAALRQYGAPPVFIASLTAVEKAVLFMVSGGLALWGAAWLLDSSEVAIFLGKVSFTQIIIAVMLSVFASLWYGKASIEVKLFNVMRSQKSIGHIFEVFAITLVAQLLVVSAFVVGTMGLSPEIDIVDLIAAAAITSFAASLPISVNGWGVREVAAIYAFGYVGVPASSALAISILVGLCSTAVVLAAYPYALKKKKT